MVLRLKRRRVFQSSQRRLSSPERQEGEPFSRRLPLPHQSEALDYGELLREIALFMEMRLGKTMVAIRWLLAKGDALLNLIVAPLSVLYVWKEELALEGIHNVYILTGSQEKRMEIIKKHKNGWFLCNYEGLTINKNKKKGTPRRPSQILIRQWDSIILDESVRIKSPKAFITICLLKHSYAKYKAILTGLPAPEGPQDYFCQMKFLHGGFMGESNYWAFMNRYFRKDFKGWNWTPHHNTRVKIKECIHEKAFVRTRKQAGIGSPKIYEKRYVEMSSKQKKAYNKLEEQFIYEAYDKTKETKWITTNMIWLARLAGGFDPDGDKVSDEKIKELRSLLETELKEESVVVWFRFNKEIKEALKYLKKKIKKKNISCHYVAGDNKSQRDEIISEFQKGKFRVLLFQIKCGQYGIKCSRASTAIYFSNNYDFNDRRQSEDRILHMEKKEPLLYIDLITKGTIDEAIVKALREKGATASYFMSRLLQNWKTDFYAKVKEKEEEKRKKKVHIN